MKNMLLVYGGLSFYMSWKDKRIGRSAYVTGQPVQDAPYVISVLTILQ